MAGARKGAGREKGIEIESAHVTQCGEAKGGGGGCRLPSRCQCVKELIAEGNDI